MKIYTLRQKRGYKGPMVDCPACPIVHGHRQYGAMGNSVKESIVYVFMHLHEEHGAKTLILSKTGNSAKVAVPEREE